MTTPYGFGTTVPLSYEEAIPRVKEALKAEGFGVLTEIDVRRTMREKLAPRWNPISSSEPAIPRWRIAHLNRNQTLAYSCHVMSSCDLKAMLGIVGNEELNAVADEAKRRLQRVIASLGGQA